MHNKALQKKKKKEKNLKSQLLLVLRVFVVIILWPLLLKRWIAISTESITQQWIMQLVSTILFGWIVIFSLDNTIHPSVQIVNVLLHSNNILSAWTWQIVGGNWDIYGVRWKTIQWKLLKSIYAPCLLANKPCAVQCALLGVSSVCWENWTDTLICRNLATQLSGRLLIIPNQITQKPEIKTSSQQRWGQTRQSPDRPLETGPPHPKPKQCTVPEQEIL